MSITDFFKRSFKIEDQDYLDLLDEIRAGLADHSLDYSMIHFFCNAPKLPHWNHFSCLSRKRMTSVSERNGSKEGGNSVDDI